MSLDRFCRRPLAIVHETDNVYAAARTMRDYHVGAVVVVDEAGSTPVGLLTDRDIACRVVAQGMNPKFIGVTSVMSHHPIVARRDEDIDGAVMRMREAGVRRLPIVDEQGKLAGFMALDDLTVLLAGEMEQAASVLRANRGP
jgi:CBS domain-containing protein